MKNHLYIIAALFLALSCQPGAEPEGGSRATVNFIYGESATKTLAVDDVLISNCNIFVYNQSGALVESAYSGSGAVPSLSLLCAGGETYKFYCVCNTGDITGIGLFSRETALVNYQYSVADYDDIIDGNGAVPMTGSTPPLFIADGMNVHITLTRCVALISLRLDDTALVESTIEITSIRMRNTPRKVGLFQSSAVQSAFDRSASGDRASAGELAAVNNGGAVEFYMLENDQGELLPSNTVCQTKWFEDGSVYEDICSYMELEGTYDNQGSSNPRHGTFTYRFYLGENETTDFSVIRNRHYHIVVKLNDDGVDEVSWRVDSDLTPYGSSSYPIRIRPTILSLDGWMLASGSGTDSFGVRVIYADGSSRLLTGAAATALIVNGDEWDIEGNMLYAPEMTGESCLSLAYSENGHTVRYESCGSVVKPEDFYTASAAMQVAKKYGDNGDTPTVVSNIVCYSDHEVELSDWLTFYSDSSYLEYTAGCFRLKGGVTVNGDLNFNITGSLTDSFGNNFSKTMTFITTVFKWCRRYYSVTIDTDVREHIDTGYGSQEPGDDIVVTVRLVVSGESGQFIARYFFPASYDEHGELLDGYFTYTWYHTTITQQMQEEREYVFNHSQDGNPLPEGYCYDNSQYIYYQPLN